MFRHHFVFLLVALYARKAAKSFYFVYFVDVDGGHCLGRDRVDYRFVGDEWF